MTGNSKSSTVDWETDIYARGEQINLWPFSDLVSTILRETSGRDRKRIRVLETGCGAGNNILFLGKAGFEACGLDLSKTAIAFAQRRLSAEGLQADLRVGDIATLPYPSEHFDYVLDRGALTCNHREKLEQIIDEVLRVLKPAGKLFSFDLFGTNHPQMRFGTEVAHHCRDHFTQGDFARLGLTMFFDRDDIKGLFASFKSIRVTRKLELDENDDISSETYNVFATK